MNVIIYRIYAIKGDKSVLMENENLLKSDPDGKRREKYLYGDGVYFVG